MDDAISRQAAIDQLHQSYNLLDAEQRLEDLPPAQQEQPSEIQDIFNYLDTVLHPIISPEHWDVYSDLHDMISTIPSSEPKLGKKDMPDQGDSAKFGVITGETCAYWDSESNICALHSPSAQPEITRIEQELHGKTPEEQYEFLYWLLLKYGLTYTDSRLAVIEWLRGEQDEH